MKTKIVLFLILCVVLCSVFCFSVSALGDYEQYSQTNAEYYTAGPLTYADYDLSYIIEVYIQNEPNNFDTFYFLDVAEYYNYLRRIDYANSTESVLFLIGITDPNSRVKDMFDTIYANPDMQTNLDILYLNLTQIADRYRRESQLELTVTDLQSSNSLLQAEKENLSNEITTLNNEIDSLEHDVSLKEQSIQNLADLNDELMRENSALKEGVGSQYSLGFNDGLESGKVFINGIKTIFSAPSYVFAEIFDFTLFGLNFLNILKVLITIMVVGFVVKLFI